jgi:hypothetical protein
MAAEKNDIASGGETHRWQILVTVCGVLIAVGTMLFCAFFWGDDNIRNSEADMESSRQPMASYEPAADDLPPSRKSASSLDGSSSADSSGTDGMAPKPRVPSGTFDESFAADHESDLPPNDNSNIFPTFVE